ncbi:MAG TPA: MBL fold metallo-hydrolase [Blastocatellia bacterium]|nr:MBL fold metallo-hydrolase [Blastocatellia bacterium]
MRKGRIKRLLLWVGAAVLALLALLVYTFTPAKLDVAAYPAAVFKSPELNLSTLPETSLSVIECGKMMSKQVFVFRGGHWSEDYESGMAAVLVRHPKGTLLFDTGFGANVDEHVKTIPTLMRRLTTYDKETSAAAQLKAHGFEPGEIKMAIISHSHWDHVSGLEDLPQAEAWFSREEIDDIPKLPASELIKQMSDKLELHALDLNGPPYENFDRSLDLYQDGSIVLVPLPGHTPGSIGMFVNLRSGKRFLFIGDLTWALEGIELPAERPWVSRKLVDRDETQVRASIVKVYQLSKRYPDLVVVPAHDRRVHNRIANFPDFEH